MFFHEKSFFIYFKYTLYFFNIFILNIRLPPQLDYQKNDVYKYFAAAAANATTATKQHHIISKLFSCCRVCNLYSLALYNFCNLLRCHFHRLYHKLGHIVRAIEHRIEIG